MSNDRQIKTVLYRLKRDFGRPVSFCTILAVDQDILTGLITKSERTVKIVRAPVLDVRSGREFSYDLSFIAANKNFTYGGLFDSGSRIVVVDGADMPKDYVPTLNDTCIIGEERYSLASISKTIYDLGFIFQVKRLSTELE